MTCDKVTQENCYTQSYTQNCYTQNCYTQENCYTQSYTRKLCDIFISRSEYKYLQVYSLQRNNLKSILNQPLKLLGSFLLLFKEKRKKKKTWTWFLVWPISTNGHALDWSNLFLNDHVLRLSFRKLKCQKF